MTFLRLHMCRLSACLAPTITLSLGLILTLSLTLMSPVAAIQNIGFPDQQRLIVGKADLTSFQSAQKAMHDALMSVVKYDGVDGSSKETNTALKTISTNAQILQDIAKRAGNDDIATFMATIDNWSISNDAEDRSPELVRKIAASLLNLKVKTK